MYSQGLGPQSVCAMLAVFGWTSHFAVLLEEKIPPLNKKKRHYRANVKQM